MDNIDLLYKCLDEDAKKRYKFLAEKRYEETLKQAEKDTNFAWYVAYLVGCICLFGYGLSSILFLLHKMLQYESLFLFSNYIINFTAMFSLLGMFISGLIAI